MSPRHSSTARAWKSFLATKSSAGGRTCSFDRGVENCWRLRHLRRALTPLWQCSVPSQSVLQRRLGRLHRRRSDALGIYGLHPRSVLWRQLGFLKSRCHRQHAFIATACPSDPTPLHQGLLDSTAPPKRMSLGVQPRIYFWLHGSIVLLAGLYSRQSRFGRAA